MGRYALLASVEKALAKVARDYDYVDVDFTTEDVGSKIVKIEVECHTESDRSVGIFPGSDVYVYKLTERVEDERPVGYAVEVMGVRPGKDQPIVAIEFDYRDLAIALGDVAARELFALRYEC